MLQTFTHVFDTPVYKGKTSFSASLLINDKAIDGVDDETLDVVNPATGKVIATVSLGTAEDVDIADNAREAFNTRWGLNVPGAEQGRLLMKLTDLVEECAEELTAIEALNNGKTFNSAKNADVALSIQTFRYYGGWANKNHGKVMETDENKLAYTRHEPIGVCGQIIPWNFPLHMIEWKIGPALATGNTVVLKPSKFTPVTALRMVGLIEKAGFPPGIVNIVNEFWDTARAAISEHPDIDKVAFTGSTLVGREIMEAARETNLKKVTLELGGKSPNVIFDDADVDQAFGWAVHGILWKFTAQAQTIKLGDPFGEDTYQGLQVSQVQYDRIMDYIELGKKDGATLRLGGMRFGMEGYFIQPSIFIRTHPAMKIVREEIFGPVAVVIRFTDEDDAVHQANDTHYGLAASVFSKNVDRALRVAHRLHTGTARINCANSVSTQVPFGGYKRSGMGRELGEYSLTNCIAVKAVHVNIGVEHLT